MRVLCLDEIEFVSGGIDGIPEISINGNSDGSVNFGGNAQFSGGGARGGVQDGGEVVVTAKKPFITLSVPQNPTVSINIDAPPSLSSNAKINFNLNSIGAPGAKDAGNNELGGLNSLSHR